MAIGDYVILQVEAGDKLKEIYMNPAALPLPGAPIVILQGNSLSHKQSIATDTVGDYHQTVDLVWNNDHTQAWLMLIEQRHNGETLIPENFITLQHGLKPTDPFTFNITQWITDNVLPISGELPDKGVMFELDLQFWMNHYYEELRGEMDVFHRTLTASKVVRFAMLRSNYDEPIFVPGGISEISFSGSFMAYVSKPTLYYNVSDYGELVSTAFPVSIVPEDVNFLLKVENNLRNQTNWETLPNWDVSLLIRAKVKEFSMYDITTEIIN
jgi:hypothetical protein